MKATSAGVGTGQPAGIWIKEPGSLIVSISGGGAGGSGVAPTDAAGQPAVSVTPAAASAILHQVLATRARLPIRSRSVVAPESDPAILTTVGYNPYRKFQARPSDYLLVALAVIVAIALVAWAFLG